MDEAPEGSLISGQDIRLVQGLREPCGSRELGLRRFQILGRQPQGLGPLEEFGGPLLDHPFDPLPGGLELRLAFGDLPHFADALNARADQENVLEDDPARVLDPSARD